MGSERLVKLLIIILLGSFLYFRYRIDQDCGKFRRLNRMRLLKRMADGNLAQKYITADLCTDSRLANRMFEFASLYGISKYLNRQPVVYIKDKNLKTNVEKLMALMPNFMAKFELRLDMGICTYKNLTKTREVKFNKKCCAFDHPLVLRNLNDETVELRGRFFQSYKYFNEHRDELRSFIVQEGDFGQLPIKTSKAQQFITCIHIRRTDFVDGHHHASDANFIRAARDFIARKENQTDMITVLMSDDIPFSKRVLENVTNVFVSENSPEDDLIYSRSNCDATLITAPSSTFGWWIGYFSKGEKVYYLDITTTSDAIYKIGHLVPSDFFDPRWTALKFDSSRQEVEVSG